MKQWQHYYRLSVNSKLAVITKARWTRPKCSHVVRRSPCACVQSYRLCDVAAIRVVFVSFIKLRRPGRKEDEVWCGITSSLFIPWKELWRHFRNLSAKGRWQQFHVLSLCNIFTIAIENMLTFADLKNVIFVTTSHFQLFIAGLLVYCPFCDFQVEQWWRLVFSMTIIQLFLFVALQPWILFVDSSKKKLESHLQLGELRL